MALKVILPVIDYELKFVKRQFFYDNNKQKKIEMYKSRILCDLNLLLKSQQQELKVCWYGLWKTVLKHLN